jgi:dTDP-4-amino-4,6-dideoxygalactose transaminase
MSGRWTRNVVANDFAAQWDEVRSDAMEAVDRVGRSGWLILGEEVRAFEREFAEWWGVDHAVGVASGLDAIEIGLRCCGVQPGDRVLTTPLTAFATTLAIQRAGAEPVFCDVDESGSVSLDAANAALAADPSIRAFVPVHLYGHPLDPVGLRDLVQRHGVVIIEDCAQSAGASRGGAPTGLAGRVAATSLYPTKNLGAMGDGGVLLTSDESIAEHAETLRNYGQRARHAHVEAGLNSRLDELHAAILRSALLPRLSGWLARRAEIAQRYAAALENSRVLRAIRPTGGRSSNHLFPVETLEEDAAAALAGAGVAVGRHYPVLCPDQPACGRHTLADELLAARRIAEREISLPLHPYLTDGDVEHVIEKCLELDA